MLLQDEAIAIILSRAGQVYVSAADLGFDDQILTDTVFVPAVREYENYRPLTDQNEAFYISGSGTYPPSDCKKVITIKPRSLARGLTFLIPTAEAKASHWFMRDGMIFAEDGEYIIQYTKAYTVNRGAIEYEVYNTGFPAVETTFKLKAKPVPNTLSLESGSLTAALTGSTFDGDLGTGTYDEETLKITFTPAAELANPLNVKMYTQNPYVDELDIGEEKFLSLLTVRLLGAIGSARSQLSIEDVPVDINGDDLQSYARTKEEELKQFLEEGQKWWVW